MVSSISVVLFSSSAASSHLVLQQICQSVEDNWMWFSTCSSYRQHVIITPTLFLAHCRRSLSSPLSLITCPQRVPLPPSLHFPSLYSSCPFFFAWAACGKQVNKSLSSSGEDNEAAGDTRRSADVCRCLAWSHVVEDRTLDIYPPGICYASRKTHGLLSGASNKHFDCRKRIVLAVCLRLSNIWKGGDGDRGSLTERLIGNCL